MNRTADGGRGQSAKKRRKDDGQPRQLRGGGSKRASYRESVSSGDESEDVGESRKWGTGSSSKLRAGRSSKAPVYKDPSSEEDERRQSRRKVGQPSKGAVDRASSDDGEDDDEPRRKGHKSGRPPKRAAKFSDEEDGDFEDQMAKGKKRSMRGVAAARLNDSAPRKMPSRAPAASSVTYVDLSSGDDESFAAEATGRSGRNAGRQSKAEGGSAKSSTMPSAEKAGKEGQGDIEFEVQDRTDEAWYDVDLLKIAGKRVRVSYANLDEEYEAWVDPAQLRVRSREVDGVNVTLEVGSTVIAFQESDDASLYYDADVIEVRKGQSTDDNYLIKWLNGPGAGETEWQSIEKLFLAQRRGAHFTAQSLSALFPSMAPVVKGPALRADCDMIEKGFLGAWIRSAVVPAELAPFIRAGVKEGRVSGVVEDILWSRVGENAEREFKVKWVGCCHRKCQWLTRKVLLHIADRKLFNYERKQGLTSGRDKESDVDDESEEEEDDSFEGIRAEWLQVDRIVAEDRGQLLVKWKGLGYDQATWEAKTSMKGDSALIDRYKAYCQRYREKSRSQKGPTPQKKFALLQQQPSYLRGGQLFPYQMEGLNWLRSKYVQGQSVMLADEMGLGKTVQVVSFLASLQDQAGPASGPFIIIVPLSTLPNWRRELELWAPQLNAVMYSGSKEARSLIRKHEFDPDGRGTQFFDVLCTSYEVALVDAPLLSRVKWDCLVIDEGQRLKNDKSMLFGALDKFQAFHKVLMTGTPLQNNLGELFNLMSFLTSGLVKGSRFPSAEQFDEENKGASAQERIQRLHELLGPYVLRRLKKDQKLDVLPKVERMVKVTLTPVQRRYYAACLTKNYKILCGSDKQQRSVGMHNVVMQLRKCCNHAYLFDSAEPVVADEKDKHSLLVAASGKLELLEQLLAELKKGGHRVLLFSQFTSMLDILETYLEGAGYNFLRIDGSIASEERQRSIDSFNDPSSKSFVFLLSTRAGGLGINLATADTVIIYDSDYNPHRDLQALARAHRIGQSKKVLVLRLCTTGTVEEKMISIAASKMALESIVVNSMEENKGSAPSMKEMQEMLRHGAAELILMASQKGRLELDQKLGSSSKVPEGGKQSGAQEEGGEKWVPRELQNLNKESRQQEQRRQQMEEEASPWLEREKRFRLSAEELKAMLDRKEGDAVAGEESFLSSFKVDESMKASASDALAVSENDSHEDYWTKLLAERAAEREKEEWEELGKGKRDKRQVSYNENQDDDRSLMLSDEEDIGKTSKRKRKIAPKTEQEEDADFQKEQSSDSSQSDSDDEEWGAPVPKQETPQGEQPNANVEGAVFNPVDSSMWQFSDVSASEDDDGPSPAKPQASTVLPPPPIPANLQATSAAESLQAVAAQLSAAAMQQYQSYASMWMASQQQVMMNNARSAGMLSHAPLTVDQVQQMMHGGGYPLAQQNASMQGHSGMVDFQSPEIDQTFCEPAKKVSKAGGKAPAGKASPKVQKASSKATSSNAKAQEAQGGDEDVPCDVCAEREWEDGNEIFICDGPCGKAFHFKCLSGFHEQQRVLASGDDDWLCSECIRQANKQPAEEGSVMHSPKGLPRGNRKKKDGSPSKVIPPLPVW